MLALAWSVLAVVLALIGMRLGRLPGPQPRTISEVYQRFRALGTPLPHRAARWMLLLLSIVCLAISVSTSIEGH